MEKGFSKKRQYKIAPARLFETKTEILQAIDKLCEENGLIYFAFGKLLVGCVYYQSQIPEEETVWDIGLLRPDYERLIQILEDFTRNNDLYLDKRFGKTQYPAELFRLGKNCLVEVGELLIKQPCWVYLSPFDRLPEDFDCFCGLIRKMRYNNFYYSRMLRAFTGKSIKARLLKTVWRYVDSPQKAFARRDRIAKQYTHAGGQRVGRVIKKKSEVLSLEQLLPVQRLPFGSGTLPCPADYSAWTIPMTPALEEQTRQIQSVDLFVLQEFDRVCRLLDIGYFVCGGTLLGAIRHKGFIPWDDDVDVGMLREDYNRFLKEAGKYLDHRCFLQTRESDPKIPYLFSKIRVNHTEYITHYNENRDFHKGICLDLFPFDVLPADAGNCKHFLKKTKRLIKQHNLVCNKQLPEPVDKRPPESPEEKWWQFIGHMQRRVFKLIPLAWTQRRYIRHVTRYNDMLQRDGDCTVASFVPTYTYIKTQDLLPYQDSMFENIQVKVPKRPEVFLSMQYKNYMELPPAHKQNGHVLIRYSAKIESEK